MKHLHPLHTPKWLSSWINQGIYPDIDRCTGRSTAQGLELIAKALQQPHVWHDVRDHWGNQNAHTNLRRIVQDQVKALGLNFFHFRETAVCFTQFEPPK